MRFLHIKRAYTVDESLVYEVQRDLALNMKLLEDVYSESTHDVCSITEDGEWLMHGRIIDPTVVLQLYFVVFIYIHSPSSVYDRAMLLCSAHAQKHVSLYHALDKITHHTERLASLIKTQRILAKIPHEVYLDMSGYNENHTSSESIAGAHIRNVFLPIHIIPSSYVTHTPYVHTTRLAHTYSELAEHIEAVRHTHTHITLREHIQGDFVYVVSIPNFRDQRTYITMPLVSKSVEGLIHFQEAKLGDVQKKEISHVVENLSRVLFGGSSCVVYKLKAHGKRGIFVEGTIPAYFFMLHNYDFLYTLASSHGVSVQELFEKFW
jgi:hypothetical protein